MASRLSRALEAYRIADARRPLFDGGGAARFGARWNSPGRRVIYAAATYAGAMLEMLVHTNIGRVPKHQKYVQITIPAGLAVDEIGATEVPGWDAPDLVGSRAYGNVWYDSRRSVVLIVPSVVARIERNVLINQEHPDFGKIIASEPQPVVWDDRLFQHLREK